jgi:hypothetical protein
VVHQGPRFWVRPEEVHQQELDVVELEQFM